MATFDPTDCYLAMYDAMRRGDPVVGRRFALELQAWLEGNGGPPPRYSPLEVRAYLASVLRRTVGYDEEARSAAGPTDSRSDD